MMHKRCWAVGPVASVEELAGKICKTGSTWTLCTGFYVLGHPDYLFLNDSSSENSAGEWAAIKGGLGATEHRQVETITFSWCTHERAVEHILAVLRGEYDAADYAYAVTPQLEAIAGHRCYLCA
jgi:hypothetical protein